MFCVNRFTRGTKSINRRPRIKTWIIGNTKVLQRYKLTNHKKWIIMLGLNPSQGIDDLMDETNLQLCNYIISSKINGDFYKGYYLVNLSSVMKTQSMDLVYSDFTEEHSKWLKSFLQHSQNQNIDVCLFYGRNVHNQSVHKKGLHDEVMNEIRKIFNNGKLYITVDSNPNNVESFDKFSHPSIRTIAVRKAIRSDLKDIGL